MVGLTGTSQPTQVHPMPRAGCPLTRSACISRDGAPTLQWAAVPRASPPSEYKNFPLTSNLKLSSFTLKPSPRPISICPSTKLLSFLFVNSFKYWKVAMTFTHSLLFSEQAQLL